MEEIIKQIIFENTPKEASNKIFDLIRKSFEGGRDSIEAEIGYEHFGNMEAYPRKKIIKSFKTWVHEFKLKTKNDGKGKNLS